MIYVVGLIKTNKSFSAKNIKEVTFRKTYVVKQMFGGLKICVCYLFRSLRLPQSRTP